MRNMRLKSSDIPTKRVVGVNINNMPAATDINPVMRRNRHERALLSFVNLSKLILYLSLVIFCIPVGLRMHLDVLIIIVEFVKKTMKVQGPRIHSHSPVNILWP